MDFSIYKDFSTLMHPKVFSVQDWDCFAVQVQQVLLPGSLLEEDEI